jgi:hypothetical protein
VKLGQVEFYRLLYKAGDLEAVVGEACTVNALEQVKVHAERVGED